MDCMRSRHRWGAADFTRNLATAEPVDSRHKMRKIDASNLYIKVVALVQDLMGSFSGVDVIKMISSMIVYQQAPRTYNQFSYHLGIYLHSLGTKRRALSTLAGLGLIPSYTAIKRKYGGLIEIVKVALYY